MKRHQTVDRYIAAADKWQKELVELRSILNSTELVETVKWGGPCYTIDGKNVVGIAAFKSYFGIWFFQGALLNDTKNLLINAQEGKTKALRQMRFQSMDQIDPRIVKVYVKEAIALAKKGVEIKPDRSKPVELPTELEAALRRHKTANANFQRLTPGKQREYAEYISSAKRDETKQSRLAKILPMIGAGLGLNDKYRNS